MPLPWEQIQANAVTFPKRWKDAWDEKSEAQGFVEGLLRVFGVDDSRAVGRFEERALREAGRGFMDYFWPKKIAIEPYIGSYEFINNQSRWCLWLKGATPKEIKQCPTVMKRIESVRAFRANSVAAATRKFAETPTLFCQIAQPDTGFIIVPSVSSERRKYIFLTLNILRKGGLHGWRNGAD